LILAGAGTGVGAGLFANGVLTQMNALASARSRPAAMALSSATANLGGFLGGTVSGPLYTPFGFGGVVLFGFVAEAAGVPALVAGLPGTFRKRSASMTAGES
jgi:predicted MFS family arabinose efflux permease